VVSIEEREVDPFSGAYKIA
jgi:hypothetical protein